MKKFVVYDNAGKILRWGVSSNVDVERQAEPGQKVVIVNSLETAFDLNHKVSNGKIVRKKAGGT